MRTQWKKGLSRPPVSTLSSPLYQRMLQLNALSSLRQRGTDLREFALEFRNIAEGLGYNDSALKDLFKGIVHFEIKIWYVSAYPKGIQDVGVFFSSVDPILMFLGQTVLVCQSYNGRYRSLSLWEGKRTCTEKFPIVTTHWWPKTRNERFVWENEQYLYCFLPLVHNHVQMKWVRTHIRCVTCVCARSGSRLTEGVSEAWCWGNCHRSCRFWTVYSRIMMTYFKQTRLLSSLYLYTSAPCIRFIHL